MPSLATPTWQSVTQVLVWGGVLIAVIVVFFGGLWYYRKRLLGGQEDSSGAAWTLDDVQRMRQEGQLTEEEYRALRAALVAAYRGEKSGPGGPKGPISAQGPVSPGEEADKNGPDFDLRNGPTG